MSATIERPIEAIQFLFDERQAARVLAMSERQLRALGAKIPSIKVGRSRRYHIDDLRAFADKARQAS